MIRNSGACNEMGMPAADVFRAYIGSADGPSHGRDGHYGDFSRRILPPVSIVGEATLSFLGIGVQAPTADWGQMIADAQQSNAYQHAWWFLVFPSLALLVTTLAFNIFGDGVRDAFDPRSDRLFK